MSTDHATAPEATTSEAPAATEKRRSPVRTAVLFLLLILAVSALLIDRRAQSRAQDLHNRLDRMRSVPADQLPTIEVVHEHIGRTPDDAYDHNEVANTKVEEYHYNVPWRTNVVYVYYRTMPDVRLDAVSLNQPLTQADL